ncbi:Globin-coupled histidine kinase [Rosistilla oblonga]|uniref:sensor histidine kinase n=1 Tax=Rosistilla oblonga TaxID=2527990 RepID=UPI00118B5297|nr:HAMP domain-containing sensor histidine kinase [Rosistilla oblonga]QDV11578.1 Globin-coupled histidine kinase [Rosistilla oblonga]
MHDNKTLFVALQEGANRNVVNRAFIIPHQDESLDIYDVLILDESHRNNGQAAVAAILQHDLTTYAAIILDSGFPSGTAESLLAQLSDDTSCLVATSRADIKTTFEDLSQEALASDPQSSPTDLLKEMYAMLSSGVEPEQRQSQRERLESIGLAVASVAHETRNALQRIQVHLDLLRMNEGDALQRMNDLTSIEQANRCLWTLFNELQDFSAPLQLQCESVSVRGLVDSSWESLRGREGWDRAELKLDIPNVCATVDPIRIEQVLRNLMENAIDACDDKAAIEIAAASIQLNGREALQITVRDNGSGIRPEFRQNAFEPFYTTKSRGSGLGLPICKRIVEAHGGRLGIDPKIVDGTAFLIVLPVGRSDTCDC